MGLDAGVVNPREQHLVVLYCKTLRTLFERGRISGAEFAALEYFVTDPPPIGWLQDVLEKTIAQSLNPLDE